MTEKCKTCKKPLCQEVQELLFAAREAVKDFDRLRYQKVQTGPMQGVFDLRIALEKIVGDTWKE